VDLAHLVCAVRAGAGMPAHAAPAREAGARPRSTELAPGRGRLAALLREPLVLFALGGAVLFIAYEHYAPAPPVTASRDIAVTPAQIAAFRRDLEQLNGHAPSDAELWALVQEYADDEVLYREALALGLDRGDLVVHRRLEQKMRFLIEDTARLPPAAEAELEAYLNAHRAEFVEPARVRFSQVFIARDLHGDDSATLAQRLREDLVARGVTAAQARTVGDAFPAGFDFDLLREDELVRYFGADFAATVMQLPLAQWSQPVASTHGLHLLWVSERVEARAVTLDEVRERVQYAYDRDRRDQANAARLAALRARYTVQLPAGVVPATTPPAAAAAAR
jgi:peptidyl-prolyl cis-trans isomerase C